MDGGGGDRKKVNSLCHGPRNVYLLCPSRGGGARTRGLGEVGMLTEKK
jgi:hypothetical protein